MRLQSDILEFKTSAEKTSKQNWSLGLITLKVHFLDCLVDDLERVTRLLPTDAVLI